MSEPRYSVGIDLGTTHCVLSYVDLQESDPDEVAQHVFGIPQLTGPGAVEERPALPSFLYIAHPDELTPGDRSLPWNPEPRFVVGELARNLGASTPIRLVSSAKSWLCHPGVDRRASILPVAAPQEVEQLSPLAASTCYLEHLRDAWNQMFPDAPLDEQAVTLTVPASFDPAARELTAEAAAAAGLPDLILLEEPQAALYSWIQASAGGWRKQVEVGDIILVVDLGGGTTDLSVIAVTESEGSLELTRVAVGDHILLGGDNMDLALAHVVRAKLAAEGKQLDLWQLQALTHGCRTAKETLLTDPDVPSVPVVVPSRGSKLIGGTLRTELTREEVSGTLVEGFFPLVDASARPAARARTALTKLGLPYAQDAAVTRHLAAFLARQLGATADLQGFHAAPEGSSFLHPTAVLFNGGVFKAGTLAERTLQTLNGWLEAENAPRARLLEGADLDLAVASGAAYYGYVRGGRVCASAAVPPSPTTWASRAPCRRYPAWSRPSRPCASRPSAWRRAARRNCRPRSSAWWWASRCAFAFSALRCAVRTRWVRCWSTGLKTSWKSWRRSRRTSRQKVEAPARWCRCACMRRSPRSVPSGWTRSPAAVTSAGRWSSTCEGRPERV